MKSASQFGSVPATMSVRTAEVSARQAIAGEGGACPACGSRDYQAALSAPSPEGLRSLVGCSRCGLLRFLGSVAGSKRSGFTDSVFHATPLRNWADSISSVVRGLARGGIVRLVSRTLREVAGDGFVLETDGGDGNISRALEQRQAGCLLLSPVVAHARTGFHRHGVFSVVAETCALPVREQSFDVVLRLRGFAGEADPARWLQEVRSVLRPGGRLVLQVYDSACWAFLITGSKWAGLEPGVSRFAYRHADLDVLLDFCGFHVRRRSYFFPLRNACVWASSLFPTLDPELAGQRGSSSLLKCLAYFGMVAILLPISLVESVCHSGSVLLVEAEAK